MDTVQNSSVMRVRIDLQMVFWTNIGLNLYGAAETKALRNLVFKQMVLLQTFRDLGIPAYLVDPTITVNQNHLRFTHWKIEEVNSIVPMDNDARLTSGEQYWVGIEISSPRLSIKDDGFDSMFQVVEILRSLGGETPSSTGFYVHVGMTTGYTFEHLRGIIALAAIAYKQFRQFHPKERVLSRDCVCPSVQFELPTPYTIALSMDTCGTLSELIELVHLPLKARLWPDRYCIPASVSRHTAISLLDVANGRQSIEFRAHCGTLDGNAIFRWVLTCIAIVEVGSKFSSLVPQLIDNIEHDHHVNGHHFTAVHLLQGLGKPELANLWANDLYLHTWGHRDPWGRKDRYTHLSQLLVRKDGTFEPEDEDIEDEHRDPQMDRLSKALDKVNINRGH